MLTRPRYWVLSTGYCSHPECRMCITSPSWRVARPFHDFSFPIRNCGCPALAFFARAGTMLPIACACHAYRSAPHLRRSSPALYHLFLLSALAILQLRSQPRLLPHDTRRDSPALPLCSRRICSDAGTYPLLITEPEVGNAVHSDASVEAAHGWRSAAQAQAA